METVANFIHGECVTGSGQRIQAIFNPATGEQIRQVVMSTAQETERTIAAAQQAFAAWSRQSPLKRARVLFRFKALLEQNMDSLARLVSEEHGKVYSDAVGELTRGLEVVEFACGIPHLQKGEHSANVGTGVDSHSLMQPLGVCAGITPFNFPAMVPMWMFPIALATGNTFGLYCGRIHQIFFSGENKGRRDQRALQQKCFSHGGHQSCLRFKRHRAFYRL